MRYLNKIIFVNSANIPYTEISVDGNVHFTGTQGVGKSTLLRSLLFFYNADKQKLGIQQGQKPFDEFYFRQANSYILYEVMRDEGAYTILVSRYQGRATWRFIDAPYQQSWLVNDDRMVLSDWVKIRERIDPDVVVSARIDSGAMFRDILFGNTHDTKYVRYALTRSAHYQNIPRSIQNVFLNTKLDADFIKNTIIQSMSDEDQPIDLQTYRRLVADFEREYIEIDCWYRIGRDGKCLVRQLAQKVTDQGRTIVALDQKMSEVWWMLNYAVRESEKQIPVLETKVEGLASDIKNEQAKQEALSEEFNKKKDTHNQELGARKSKLKEIAQKRKEFEALAIEEKLALADREVPIRQKASACQTMLDELLRQHKSIESKYRVLQGQLENDFNAAVNAQKDKLNDFQQQQHQRRKQLEDVRTQSRNQLMEAYRAWLRDSDERLKSLRDDQSQADNALRELHHWHPKEAEQRHISEQLQQLEVKEKELAAQQTSVKFQLEKNQAEYEQKENELTQESERKCDRLKALQSQYLNSIEQIDKLLAHLDGSLYQWLSDNVTDWEETIGKVVDEQRILYASGLNPQLNASAKGLFGVKLDLENVDAVHRTPDDYRRERKALETHLKEVTRDLNHLPATLQEEVAKLGKKYSTLLNPLRQKATRLRVEIDQIPFKRQDLQNQMHRLEMEEQELVERERQVRQEAYNKSLLLVKEEEERRDKQDAKNQKELKDLDSNFNKEAKALEQALTEFNGLLDADIKRLRSEYDAQSAQLAKQQAAELAGKGVDTKLLNQYQSELNDLNRLLKTIEDNRPVVMRYRDAQENLFAIEPQVHMDIQNLQMQLDTLDKQFKDKFTRYEKKRQELVAQQRQLQDNLTRRRDGLKEYHQMVEVERQVPDKLLLDDTTVATSEDTKNLLSQFRGTVHQKRETMEQLKQSVMNFNQHFKPENAFHFNTLPISDDDYLQIAADLQEFMDNNKIEQYRQRTSEHYKDILGRISSEVGSLLKRQSDVDKVISDINRDFVEKNFAGVIRSIEMRINESSDRLMQLLISIHTYRNENMFDIGELNLFSGDNRDEVNRKVVDYLKSLSQQLQYEPSRTSVSLKDAFRLQFRVKENDNDTNWVERINNVGSDGTDILVKAMVNIMLINVFKKKAAHKSGDFIVHCMMDEIGRLHPNNIKGILQFANSRNIYLINSSPTSYNPYDYKYTYLLSKQGVKTRVEKLLKRL